MRSTAMKVEVRRWSTLVHNVFDVTPGLVRQSTQHRENDEASENAGHAVDGGDGESISEKDKEQVVAFAL